ncbi:AfsR/SARP family transcriptional regulator [Actinomycetospora atypica]|uniref:BTAD domain-containing putative transcriptional regulator n=1 Tax=Actinomycetospora atypica TaxID=1290095 RepID=A0ABV9YW72_9PSEU
MLSVADHDLLLRFRDLGSIEVEDDDVRVPGGAVLRRLLARLLVDAGRRVDVTALVEALWGERSTARSVSTLESHLYRLRRFLEPGHARGEAFTVLVSDAGGYRLAVDGEQIDSALFARGVARAGESLAAGNPRTALAECEQARTRWRGRPFSPWSDEPWATATVARLEELGRQLTETLVDALLADGHPENALVELEPVLATDPLRERPWEQYMLAAARAGRLEVALGTYRRVDRLFRDELGVEPGAELVRLHQLLLSGDATGTRTRVAAPAVVGSDPAVAPAAAPPEAHLPRRRARLIGRDAEVADLMRRLPTSPLVTLVGGAGCGKTTLAVATAERLITGFGGGVWFVDLTSALDAEQVAAAVASTLGLAGSGGSTEDALVGFTRSRRMLLVLDNCEHVLDPAAELVEQLLVPDSDLTILATSREPLEVDGEDVVHLAPLPLGASSSPAMELFLERYAAAAPERRLGAEDLATAAAICAALDGLPLAIELAAARGRAFSLAEIAEQVRTDPSGLSRVGRGGGLTVRAAVERSVRLLAPDEQDLHAAMSAVPGPMTAAMAGALVDDGAPHALVAGLVHRSLLTTEHPVRPGGASRFAQLAVVRGHGAHALDDAGTARVADRRDAFVVDTVVNRPRMGLPGDAEFQDAMDDDLPALRATLHHTLIDRPSWGGPALAAGLGMYWYYRGMLLEGGRWIGLAIRHRELARPVDDAILQSALAALHLLAGNAPLARPHLEALSEAAKHAEGADLLYLGDEFGGLTSPAVHTGDRELLALLADGADDIADRTGDPNSILLARAATLKARPLPHDDQLAAAAALHAAAQEADNHYVSWMSASDAVRACLALDDVESALVWCRRCVEDHLALGAREAPQLMELYGCLHARRGDHEATVRFLAGAHAQNRRAAMAWPTRPETPAVLEEAARRLGAATYERLWREGSRLHLTTLG